jgi:hypothetical protein
MGRAFCPLRIECPTGSGREMNLFEVARELTRRLSAIFLRDSGGRRPVYTDLGASHQRRPEPRSSKRSKS